MKLNDWVNNLLTMIWSLAFFDHWFMIIHHAWLRHDPWMVQHLKELRHLVRLIHNHVVDNLGN